VKPSYGLTDEQVEAMIEASIDHAEEDYRAAQVATARVDADTILAAIDKARRDEAWGALEQEERSAIEERIGRLRVAYPTDDHSAIRAAIEALNEATHGLAENMMNTAVRGALKGTKID